MRIGFTWWIVYFSAYRFLFLFFSSLLFGKHLSTGESATIIILIAERRKSIGNGTSLRCRQDGRSVILRVRRRIVSDHTVNTTSVPGKKKKLRVTRPTCAESDRNVFTSALSEVFVVCLIFFPHETYYDFRL